MGLVVVSLSESHIYTPESTVQIPYRQFPEPVRVVWNIKELNSFSLAGCRAKPHKCYKPGSYSQPTEPRSQVGLLRLGTIPAPHIDDGTHVWHNACPLPPREAEYSFSVASVPYYLQSVIHATKSLFYQLLRPPQDEVV